MLFSYGDLQGLLYSSLAINAALLFLAILFIKEQLNKKYVLGPYCIIKMKGGEFTRYAVWNQITKTFPYGQRSTMTEAIDDLERLKYKFLSELDKSAEIALRSSSHDTANRA